MKDDALDLYRKKRDFTQTPEPADGGEPSASALQYVIQKHWASRLHYDLRLEIDGTMKSWAVPKGPSLDPADKRMAVQVEDHPMAYNTFEGQIPPHQYGAGKVIIWDRGYWVPVGDAAEGYRKGKLKFSLHGHKLQGQWTLVRMHGRGSEKQPPWLLIKEHDAHERPAAAFSVVDEMPDSVARLKPVPPPPENGGRATPSPSRRAAGSAAGKKTALPERLAPQLATLVDSPPADPDAWAWELKFDGYRLLARVDGGEVRLFTRNGNDWTAKMPQLARALAALEVDSAWIDGEVLVLDSNGVPDFQALQNAFDAKAVSQLVYYAFDLPFAHGRDLRALPLVERHELLRAVVGQASSGRVRLSESFEAAPQDLVASACRLGFEGVIGKRKDAAYVSRRSADWIKIKCSHRQEFVIGGYTDPQGSRTGIGSLLLGVHESDGSLRYAGNVGTGFSERTLTQLKARLSALQAPASPFANPRSIGKKAHWVRPELVAEVSFAEWTKEGRVRHSVFHGLRADKPAGDIAREVPQALPSARSGSGSGRPSAARPAPARPSEWPEGFRLSHPDRVVDASTGVTKLDIAHHYARVAHLMLPHLQARPVALVRAPDGIAGELFFQKHMDKTRLHGIQDLDPALDAGHAPLMEVLGPSGLLAAAQMNVVEFHTWNARKDSIERPDRMTFDLDPGEGVPWAAVQEGAELVRVLLAELGLPAWLKTSGGKGLHVVVPVKRLHGWDAVKSFSGAIVQHLAATIPGRFVARSGPRNRVGKIFVDYLRNGRGATTVAAWSARARPGMGVSVPLGWDELAGLTSSAHWTVRTVDERVATGNTPWEGYDKAAVSLGAAMKQLGFRPDQKG